MMGIQNLISGLNLSKLLNFVLSCFARFIHNPVYGTRRKGRAPTIPLSSMRAGSFGGEGGGGEGKIKRGKRVGGERENEPTRKPLY